MIASWRERLLGSASGAIRATVVSAWEAPWRARPITAEPHDSLGPRGGEREQPHPGPEAVARTHA